jgi:hypothetical protein
MRRALICLAAIAFAAFANATLYAQTRDTRVTFDQPIVNEGDNLSGHLAGPFVGEPWTISWTDPFGDVLSSDVYTGTTNGIDFSFRAGGPLSPLGSVDASSSSINWSM